jgi:hypothetical protein
MIVKAEGILAHHFWGTYYATVGLVFDNEFEAKCALDSGKLYKTFKQSEKKTNALVCMVKSDVLDEIKKNLATFGADVKAIDSVAHSIDFGDPFFIELDVDDPRQKVMF